MYEAFFHLERRPFVASPRTDHYFPARSIEQARQSLTRCISRSEGPAVIIGPAGTGKSLLCFVLAKQFREKMRIVVVQGGRLRSRKSLLQNVLFELKLPFRGLDEDELRLQLLDHLESKEPSQRRLLLIVDDAHLLRGQVLSDVAALCSVVRDGEPVIQLVLAGGPLLEEKLSHPRLESLQQRIAARSYLQALTYDETAAFIRAQIEFCGGQLEGIFSPDAVNALYRASDGIPRLVNQIGDHALLLAYLAKLQPVNVAAIEEAWSDLQQLPTPWQVTDHPAAAAAREQEPSATIIEFGSLDDAPAPPTTAELIAAEPNPVFNLEQNLWTIESGLDGLRREPTEFVELKPARETITPDISTTIDADTSDMPAFNPLQPNGSWSSPALSEFTASTPSITPISTTTNAKPQVKRVANPFDEEFDEEVVIVDGVAKKTERRGNIPTANGATEISRASVSALAEASTTPAPSNAAIDEDQFEQFDGPAIDWTNYQATSVVGVAGLNDVQTDAWNIISTEGDAIAAGVPSDDRNVLLVENDQPPRIRPVKRQEFRQLFAKLRGDQ